jgi:hypothetical protein
MTIKNHRSRPKQCYFCHPDEGKKLMSEVYKYDVAFFGTRDNFVVLPMIGAGIEGYVLIFHKHHFHSIAELPEQDLVNLKKLINIIKEDEIKLSITPVSKRPWIFNKPFCLLKKYTRKIMAIAPKDIQIRKP